MNPSQNEPKPSRQDALQAEAIEETRRRVREHEQSAAAEAQLEAACRPRRSPWELGRDSSRGWMFELFGVRLALMLAFSALGIIISAVLWLATNLRLPIYLLIRVLDTATGAQVLRGAPWVMWTLWGAIFGAALGYWLVAPLYGHRENRVLLLVLPLLAMTLTGTLLWAFVR